MHKEYILLVEDSKIVNMTLSKLLRDQTNLEVLSAMSFMECEKLVDEHKFEIVLAITDLNLPDAPEGAASDYCLKHRIPTVVLTGNYDDDLRNRLFKRNVTDYFLKENSDSIPQVVSAVKRLLKNRATKILVVDDSKMYLSFFRDMLTKQLFKPLFAKNGKEALHTISHEKDIKLVLTDYNMPEMDGLELTRNIRRNYSKDEMGVIVISDDADNKVPAKFIKHGANDFVIKPFSNEEFITRLNSNLEILELFQEAKDRANKDFMTGMFNRRYFFDEGYEVFIEARDNGKDLYVAMIDIDKFKNINDTYGHDIGDIAIKEVAKILDKNLKQFNPIISRFGGEEFCMIVKDLSPDEIREAYEQTRKNFESNIIKVGDLEFGYTVSIGIIKVTGGTLDEAVKGSDENLYEAKETGRNKVVFK